MNIAVMPGDGIGKEVTAEAVKVLQALAGSDAKFTEAPIGAAGVAAAGVPLPPATLELARKADAILFGAVGTPGDESGPRDKRPGLGLLTLRRELKLFANFRPAFLFPELVGASSLKPELVQGLDLIILRELNGDIYYGEPRGIRVGDSGRREGVNTMRYTEPEIERIAHVAFRTARERRRKVCSVDKANVLETMQLWRETVARIGRQYPNVALTHLFVDAASMQLLRAPKQFDVMVMGNMFGDILSDAAAMLTGSIGMLPSGSIGENRFGLYEPVHGSAPDIAGKDLANPLAAILSAAMMLRMSFGDRDAAERIERAVRKALAQGLRTADMMQPGKRQVGCAAMGDAVAAALA
ncbi:MAG TPA: 3-isopropylmalate dehydrogenase [Burkholderiales bacterium]|nr:3-isopropylmalate dehydrogenase [Burkholderiales bacterium]